MDASPSSALPPCSEPCSPPSPTMSANEPSDGVRGAPGALACIQPGEAGARHRKRLCSARIQPGEAGGQHRKRLCSAPPEDVGDIGDGGDGGVPGSNDVHQANDEPQSLLFSCHTTGAASGIMLDPSGGTQNLQRMRFTICF